MALSAETLLETADIHDVLRMQAHQFMYRFQENPTLGRIFGSHQKWLLAHIGLMLYYEHGALMPARFLEQVMTHGVASRNTGDSFLKEMETYRIVAQIPSEDRRSRPLVPTPPARAMAETWLAIHLETLDRIDQGARMAIMAKEPMAMTKTHPFIARNFLSVPELRDQPELFQPFVWLNNGNVVLDWLIANTVPTPANTPQVPTTISSIQSMADTFHLSRTHLTRKLREAEKQETIGWIGPRGRSILWVSDAFRNEYARAQAVKLEIIDRAWHAAGFGH